MEKQTLISIEVRTTIVVYIADSREERVNGYMHSHEGKPADLNLLHLLGIGYGPTNFPGLTAFLFPVFFLHELFIFPA